MKIDKSIFKPYDIRGVYPNQINEYTAKLIGRAVTELLNPKQAVLVKDVRIGSDKIYQSLIEGLLEGGCNVDYLGESTTDMMYFAVGKYAYDLGISVTGSHNPPNYTGIKIVTKGVIPVSGDSGIFDIQEKAAAGRFKEVSTKGSYKEVNLRKDYTNHVLSFIDSLRIKPLTLCVDIGNGAVGDAAQDVLSKLPVKVHYLFKEKDGSFPNHLPDPSKEENVRSLKKKVLETRSDLGAAFDGDGDRVFF
ncbi:phosphomannomutase/phosphoglucomutase, partial [candidate division WWE3 bacterium CG10_big_fil_rev_8_21_14_0_10_39_14]